MDIKRIVAYSTIYQITAAMFVVLLIDFNFGYFMFCYHMFYKALVGWGCQVVQERGLPRGDGRLGGRRREGEGVEGGVVTLEMRKEGWAQGVSEVGGL